MNIDFDFDGRDLKIVEAGEEISVRVMDLSVSKKKLDQYLEQVNKLKTDVASLVVQDEPSRIRAVEYGGMAAGLLKKIKATTNSIIKEPSEFVKAVKNISSPFEDSLERIKDTAAQKIKQYNAVIEQKRREDEAKLQAEARKLEERLKKEAKEKGIEAVSVPVPVLPKVQETTHTEFGSEYGREHWKFKVKEPFDENIVKVPPDCLELNEKNVRARIKMGARGEDIPGLKIWQDDSIVFRS